MVPAKLFLKAAMPGARPAPLYVVFFVTERCNASCSHCLLGGNPPATDELTLDEIEKWSRSMPDFYFFLPTGGEPFLRDDIPDIVRTFVRNCNVRNVGIPTNGSLTEKIIPSVERILSENPSTEFAIDVSIDAIGAEHDRIRNTPGLYSAASTTFSELKKIAVRNKRFNLNVALTVSSLNQHNLPAIVAHIVDGLGARNINHLLVRGKPRDPASLGVEPQKYIALNRLLEDYAAQGKLNGYTGYDIAGPINAMKHVRSRAIEQTLERRRRIVPCRAGALGAVVRPSGGVYPCELLDTRIGGLRESGYDFDKIWSSPAARAARKSIADTKCFCTYECFMTLNVLYDPAHALKIAACTSGIGRGRYVQRS